MAAPYLAVIAFWCVCRNAWVTILAYHVQILFWSRGRFKDVVRGWNRGLFVATALPCALGGVLAYFLLPFMTAGGSLGEWLDAFGLHGTALLLMVPYFGLVHPVLEQVHWGGLRGRGWKAHAAFAGYHVLVLHSLLHPAWLVLCVAILYGASLAWGRVQAKAGGGLLVPLCGHVLADIGIVVAAFLRAG